MTTLSEPAPTRIARFDRVERAVHWTTAALFLFLLLTGLVLSFGPLSSLVGRRDAVKQLHVWFGLALPVPLLVGLAGRWGAALRADVGRFNRWSVDDRRWLRAFVRLRLRRTRVRFGKFHPGQKLNAAFVGGAIPVMLLSGSVMRWYSPFPLAWRTGATFVHDWLSTALLIVIFGHIVKALSDRDAMGGMLTGSVSADWAARHHPDWPPPTDSGHGFSASSRETVPKTEEQRGD